MAKNCEVCSKQLGLFTNGILLDGRLLCFDCHKTLLLKIKEEKDRSIARSKSEVILTTTHNIDGFRVQKYIDIESIEIVIGTGVFMEITTSIEDFFGARSSGFEKKMADAKKAAMDLLRLAAVQKNGNAVIGIDLDYTEFSGNRIGLTLNGTIVEIVPE